MVMKTTQRTHTRGTQRQRTLNGGRDTLNGGHASATSLGREEDGNGGGSDYDDDYSNEGDREVIEPAVPFEWQKLDRVGIGKGALNTPPPSSSNSKSNGNANANANANASSSGSPETDMAYIDQRLEALQKFLREAKNT